MINYSILTHNLKRGILNFSEKISKGLGRVEFKFISQMLYGILNSQNIHLSGIARVLNENISLKKTIERLSVNTSTFENSVTVFKNYLGIAKRHVSDKTILIIDGSDISKPCSKKLENMCVVRDGSTGRYEMGYHTLEITALTPNQKMPIPVYTRIYSSKEDEFVSEDDEVIKGLKSLSDAFEKNNIRAFDRGYDANVYYEYLLKNEEKFVNRAKNNRNVIYKGKPINILKIAQKFKGKYSLKFKTKNNKNIECKIAIIPVSLPVASEKELNLVVVYGFGKEPMLLITNLKSDDKRLAVTITKVYLMRWRIEEYYRFKKQQFNFEDIRVRSLNSIRTLNLLLTIAIGYIGIMSEKQDERVTVMKIIYESKRIYGKRNFVFYAIADGLYSIFKKSKEGITKFLKRPSKSMQVCMFSETEFAFI